MAPSDQDTPRRVTELEVGTSHVEALLDAAGQSGRYRNVTQIGAGGIGVVYKATDTRLNRAVAIKAIHMARLAGPRTVSRLRSEALAAASLDHPYICKIYELIEAEGEQLIVMEFVEGETLANILSRGIPPLSLTLRFAVEIAEGLANAHERGLVHRDLKPNNVMVTAHGHIKLLDFGLAQVDATTTPDADTHTPPPVSDAYAGTPHYMAPEQAAGRSVTARTDVFALGVVLFRCVTGRLPFEGTTLYGYTSNLLSKDPTPLHRLAPDTPADLARLIDRCLEKTPSMRPESATAVVLELRKLSDALSSSGSAARSVQAERVRMKVRVAVAAVVLAVAAFVGWRWAISSDLNDVVWQARALVTSSSEESDSRLSPDGRWISYLSARGGTTELMVRRMDQGEPRAVAIPAGTPLSQLWSPDGDRLAFVMRQGRDVSLQVVPAFFGGAAVATVPMSPAPTVVRLLRWIDQSIYVEARDRTSRALYHVNLADGRYTNVSTAWPITGTLRGIDVSADGRRVVYVLAAAGQDDLWVANIDGTSASQLTNDRFLESQPIWSGRGYSVVYQSNRGGQVDLWETGVDSRESRPLTSSPTTEDPESTSPDGRLISFRQQSETSNLWIWNAAARMNVQLTADALGDMAPASAARGATVVFQRSRPAPFVESPLVDSTLFAGVLAGSAFSTPPTALAEGFAARLSPDGARLAYLKRGASPARAILVVRDIGGGSTVEISSTCPPPSFSLSSLEWLDQNLAWNASGTELYFVDRPDGFALRRYKVGQALADDPLVRTGPREMIYDLHLSADGRSLAYLTLTNAPTLHLIDLQSGTERWALPLTGTAHLHGWLPGDRALVVTRRVRVLEDATTDIEVLQVSPAGQARAAGAIDRAVISSVRFDALRSVVYVTRSEAGVDNLYEFNLATKALTRVTDNTLPGVTFSGFEALGGGATLGVRVERKSDIWLLDAAPATAEASARPTR